MFTLLDGVIDIMHRMFVPQSRVRNISFMRRVQVSSCPTSAHALSTLRVDLVLSRRCEVRAAICAIESVPILSGQAVADLELVSTELLVPDIPIHITPSAN